MKILYQYDPCFLDWMKSDADTVLRALFQGIDERGEKPDILLWETHRLLPSECESNNLALYEGFAEQKIDIMRRVIDETRKRGIQVYWHHRFCEVDMPDRANGNAPRKNPIKEAHPEWLIKSWRSEGVWNLAAPGLMEFKIDYIRRIAEKYGFDGICLDFLRHLPCLPVGEQWAYREYVTELMKRLRACIPARTKLGAKVPENERACHEDGFDVEKWANQRLVDFFVVGSRSLSSDVAWYQSLSSDRELEIYPCWDAWHSSDAAHWREDAFYRGIFANWHAEKADGIVGFNYYHVSTEFLNSIGIPANRQMRAFGEFIRQVTQSTDDTLPRTYAAERRGGYPYGTGAGGTNCFAPLPATLSSTETTIPMKVYDKRENATLSVVISGAASGDDFLVKLNDIPLSFHERDAQFLDRQIFYPKPQPPSGAGYCYTEHPTPLLRLCAMIPPETLKWGVNHVQLHAESASAGTVERVEITVF